MSNNVVKKYPVLVRIERTVYASSASEALDLVHAGLYREDLDIIRMTVPAGDDTRVVEVR